MGASGQIFFTETNQKKKPNLSDVKVFCFQNVF